MSSSAPGRSRPPGYRSATDRKKAIIQEALMAARANDVSQREMQELWARRKHREEMQRRLVEAARQNGLPVRERKDIDQEERDEYRGERDEYSSRDVWSAHSSQGSDDDSAYSEEEVSIIEEVFDEICDAFDAIFGDVASVFEQPEPKKKKKKKKKSEQKRYDSSEMTVSSHSTRSTVSSSGRSNVSSYSARSTGTSSGMSSRGVPPAKSKVQPPKKQGSLQLQSASQHIRSASHAKSVSAPYAFAKSPSTSSVRSATSLRSTGSRRSARSARGRSRSPARHRGKSPARRRSRSTSTKRSNRSTSSRSTSRSSRGRSDGSIRATLGISSNAKLVAQRREKWQIEKERKVKLDKLLVKLAKAEKKMNKNEYEVMETRRRIRAAAAAVDMQNILSDYDTEKREREDDFDVIGERIRDAFSDLGSVTSVARDVLSSRRREYRHKQKHDDDFSLEAVTSAAREVLGMKPSRREYYEDDDYYDDEDDDYYDDEDDDYYYDY